MQSIFVFLDITKSADFRCKNVDFSSTQGVSHVIHIFFGSSLGKLSSYTLPREDPKKVHVSSI